MDELETDALFERERLRASGFPKLVIVSKKDTHPEDTCQKCGGPNITWFAPNELWNAVNGSPNGILCPICFVEKFETKYLKGETWLLMPRPERNKTNR